MYSIKTIINNQVNSYFGKVTKYKIVKHGTFIVSDEVYYELDINGTRYLVLIPLSINFPARFVAVTDFMRGIKR